MTNITNAKLNVAKEIWYELVGFIDVLDRQEAADGFLSLLIDNDVPVSDIREALKGDEWVSESIATHAGETHHDDEEYEDWEEEDSDEIHEDY